MSLAFNLSGYFVNLCLTRLAVEGSTCSRVLLSEGRWFDSPGLQSVLGQDTDPPNCFLCAGRHLAWQPPPSVYECLYELL